MQADNNSSRHVPGALRLGTRGSPLAIVQARMVAEAIATRHPDLPKPEIITLLTTGDAVQDRPLREIGGKGLFTKELDAALADGRIDIAVHSMKDVETWLPDEIVIDCLMSREDPRDALIVGPQLDGTVDLAGLPRGATLGTSSLRRAAQISAMRPDIEIVPFRGNVDTRLAKLTDGAADATLLAVAGLNRLGRANVISAILAPEELLPAASQGAVGIARRVSDDATGEILAPLHDRETGTCVAAERAMLESLDGSCQTPIGALAKLQGNQLTLDGLLASPDGKKLFRATKMGVEPVAVGRAVADDLRAQAGEEFMAALSADG